LKFSVALVHTQRAADDRGRAALNYSAASFSFIFAFFAMASPASADACDASTRPGDICKCNLSDLRPLQGAIGAAEVQVKAADIKRDPDGEWHHLKKDPIKVVRGPGGGLYVTDHHHTARAWMTRESKGECQLQCDLSSLEPDKFWTILKDHRLARLKDKDGKDILPKDMLHSIGDLPNDPYRSLAYFVRQEHGICRSRMKQKEFAEFEWADWYRNKSELPNGDVEAAPQTFVEKAKKLAKESPKDRPDGYMEHGATCPKEEEKALDCAVLE
jgi:hypothetical protein